MKAEKVIYNDVKRIRVDFPFNQELASRIRQIEGARWSRTLSAWHIPYTQDAFNLLKSLFPEIDYPKKKNELDEEKSTVNVKPAPHLTGEISLRITPKRIFIKLPKNEKDIRLIRSLHYSRWDKHQYYWIVPNYGENAAILKNYFGGRIAELIEEKPEIREKPLISGNDLQVIKTESGVLRIIFGYHKELTAEIKKFPYCKWNAENRWWTIPYAHKFTGELQSLATLFNLNYNYEEEQPGLKLSKLSRYDIPNYKTCPPAYIEKLEELRYSEQTIKRYKSQFEEFLNFYHKNDPERIDETMIKAFMRYLVTERKISTSYQNQSINAIKFYYERILGGQRKTYYIDRPRNEKKLPVVLSEEEIVDILNAVVNIKHKAILMTIYSGGLRISEVTRLKLSDIDSKRMQIRIEQSKGKKDRYTLLSVKTLEILRRYFREYKPKVWLFEGQSGEQYASRSIQNILKMAVSKTGIIKQVTVHTLRHSFATHLLENGTDLRYIQNLLGHENSKTTEIYTHITTKGFDQIKSPLDKLNI